MTLIKKLVAFPFIFTGVILYSIGLLIRFGFTTVNNILAEFKETINFYKGIK